MNIRTKKFIGMLGIVSFMITYCLIVMALAATYITGINQFIQLVFFIIAGLAWLPVVMKLIRWMQKP